MAVSARRSRRDDDGASQLTAALQTYADRGVFRGFRVETASGGRSDYFFTWLTRTPMRLRYEPAKRGPGAPAHRWAPRAARDRGPRGPLLGHAAPARCTGSLRRATGCQSGQ